MKMTKTRIDDSLGDEAVRLTAEDPEDMWHAYNIIQPGDIVRASTDRKVVMETGSGAASSRRVRTNITIRVKSTSFDAAAAHMRVTGQVVQENEYAEMGSHHTLDLEVDRPFVVAKPPPDGWDTAAREALTEALADDKDGNVAAVVMQAGLANVCLITQHRTVLRQRVETEIPRKRSAATDQSAGQKRFFDNVLTALLRNVDFSKPRPLLLAGPGFVPANFKNFLADYARDKGDKKLTSVAKEATVVHANSGHVHSLNEILKSKEVAATMHDMRFAREARLIRQFTDKLKDDDGRAWYGVKMVERAVADGAVGAGGGVLLVNNALFRSTDLDVRRRYVALVDKVRKDGGEAVLLSSEHESGQRLDMLGGVAALLTYPMYELDEEDEEAVEGANAPAEVQDNGMVI